jgi:hypothetical protein
MEPVPNLTGQNGYLVIENGKGAEGSAYYINMSKTVNNDLETQNALNLKVNLANCGGKQLELSFYMVDYQDDTQYYDGVFLSDGTSGFKRVLALQPERWCDDTWGLFRIDLDQAIAKAGLSYTDRFVIQFRHSGKQKHEGNYWERDNLYIDEVRIEEAPPVSPATVPYETGFNSGLKKDPEWTFQTIQLNSNGEPEADMSPYNATGKIAYNASDKDGNSLYLGKWRNCNGEKQRSVADLHLNLSGRESDDLELVFDFLNNYDETDLEDGIWLSDDGGRTFPRTPAISLEPGRWAPDQYGSFQPFDLDALIRKQGLRFSSDFVIRFQQKGHQIVAGNYWERDGLFIDHVQIKVLPAIVYKKVPFKDDFENAGLNTDHYRVGTAQIDDKGKILDGTTPSIGAFLAHLYGNSFRCWHLGKQNEQNGYNTSLVDMHTDAKNYGSLILTFDLLEFWEEKQIEDGIWLSVDGGVRFKKIYDFNWDANPDNIWTSFSVPVGRIAADSGMVLSAKTVIRFQQRGTNDWAGNYWEQDGYFVKNIGLSGSVPTQNTFAEQLSFSLAPNPAHGEIFLNAFLPEADMYHFSLMNMAGQIVYTQRGEYLEAGQHQIKLVPPKTLPPGIHIARLNSGKRTGVQKIALE